MQWAGAATSRVAHRLVDALAVAEKGVPNRAKEQDQPDRGERHDELHPLQADN